MHYERATMFRHGSRRGNIFRPAFRHARASGCERRPTGGYPIPWPGDFDPFRKCRYDNWLEQGTPSKSDRARVARWPADWGPAADQPPPRGPVRGTKCYPKTLVFEPCPAIHSPHPIVSFATDYGLRTTDYERAFCPRTIQLPITSKSIRVRRKQARASWGVQTIGSFSLKDVLSRIGSPVCCSNALIRA